VKKSTKGGEKAETTAQEKKVKIRGKKKTRKPLAPEEKLKKWSAGGNQKGKKDNIEKNDEEERYLRGEVKTRQPDGRVYEERSHLGDRSFLS